MAGREIDKAVNLLFQKSKYVIVIDDKIFNPNIAKIRKGGSGGELVNNRELMRYLDIFHSDDKSIDNEKQQRGKGYLRIGGIATLAMDILYTDPEPQLYTRETLPPGIQIRSLIDIEPYTETERLNNLLDVQNNSVRQYIIVDNYAYYVPNLLINNGNIVPRQEAFLYIVLILNYRLRQITSNATNQIYLPNEFPGIVGDILQGYQDKYTKNTRTVEPPVIERNESLNPPPNLDQNEVNEMVREEIKQEEEENPVITVNLTTTDEIIDTAINNQEQVVSNMVIARMEEETAIIRNRQEIQSINDVALARRVYDREITRVAIDGSGGDGGIPDIIDITDRKPVNKPDVNRIIDEEKQKYINFKFTDYIIDFLRSIVSTLASVPRGLYNCVTLEYVRAAINNPDPNPTLINQVLRQVGAQVANFEEFMVGNPKGVLTAIVSSILILMGFIYKTTSTPYGVMRTQIVTSRLKDQIEVIDEKYVSIYPTPVTDLSLYEYSLGKEANVIVEPTIQPVEPVIKPFDYDLYSKIDDYLKNITDQPITLDNTTPTYLPIPGFVGMSAEFAEFVNNSDKYVNTELLPKLYEEALRSNYDVIVNFVQQESWEPPDDFPDPSDDYDDDDIKNKGENGRKLPKGTGKKLYEDKDGLWFIIKTLAYWICKPAKVLFKTVESLGFGVKLSVALAIFIVTSLGASMSTILTTVAQGPRAGLEEGKKQLIFLRDLINDITSGVAGTVSVASNVVGSMANITKAVFEFSSYKLGALFILGIGALFLAKTYGII